LPVQPAEKTAGVDCVQLAWVTHQEDLRMGLAGLLDQGGELERGNHGSFVDNYELIRVKAPSLLNGGEPGSFLRECDAPAVVGMSLRQTSLNVEEAPSP